jgi:lysophospholipase L1-like esterase
MKRVTLALVAFFLSSLAVNAAEIASGEVKITGDWEVTVTVAGKSTRLQVPPPAMVEVSAEKYDALPLFNPNTGGWLKGVQLRGVKAQETTTPFLLDPASVSVRSGEGEHVPAYRKDEDYALDPDWGTVGRLATGKIKGDTPVFISYGYAPLRLDSVVVGSGGRVSLRVGAPRSAAPVPPPLFAAERRLANIWLPGRTANLTTDNLFVITEDSYPEPPKPTPSPAEKLTPKALAKLRSGEPLRILAWGDSVTVGTYVPDPSRERWQNQFVARLRKRFPKANIELVTEAWGGRNTGSYLAEPPGSPHNYAEKVLGAKPDLVVSEFVNDAGLNPQQVAERYGKLLADLKKVGAEWIILTPHYVRPDWMGLTRERDIDEDPRPYVKGLRQFASANNVALADAAKRYGRLWRQGIPHSTLMLNSINHPDARGMAIFADALMELFP